MGTRMEQLSQPKPSRLKYPDRRSVYWLDQLPPKRSGSTTKIDLTPRWSNLCKSKPVSSQIMVSPIWEVSEWALRAVSSERLCHLAQPRLPSTGWQPDRLLLAPLSRGTQTAVATSRICQLAQPKQKKDPEGSSLKPKPATMAQLPSKANAHIELLATPKFNHPQFKGERSVCWPISRAARNCVTTPRLLDLSTPKERTALFEGYEPYVVSRAARSANPSPRILQLSLPLPRKCISQ